MAIFLVSIFLLASCSNSPSAAKSSMAGGSEYQSPADSLPVNSAVVTTGCGHTSPVSAGISVKMTVAVDPAESEGNSTRTFLLHLPKQYDDTRPMAVILVFHGHGGNASGMEQGSGISTLADQQHFIAVYPQGLTERFTNISFWADIGQIDYGINDVLFVSDLLNYLQRTFCVDAHRIYATGFSNGGGMTTLLACRLAGRIAAFAPMSGDHFAIPGGCHPGRPVPILYTHGTADPLVPYNGSPPSKTPDWPVPPVLQYLQTWAARDGCSSGPTIFLQQAGKSGQPGVTGMQWTRCQGNVRVVHYRIDGGGHRWPPVIEGQPAALVMWQFFSQFTLP